MKLQKKSHNEGSEAVQLTNVYAGRTEMRLHLQP